MSSHRMSDADDQSSAVLNMSSDDDEGDWFPEAAAASMAAITSASSPFNSTLVKALVIVSGVRGYLICEKMKRTVKKWGEDGLLFDATDLGILLHFLESGANPLPSCSTLLIEGFFSANLSNIEDLYTKLGRVIISFSPNLIHHLFLHLHGFDIGYQQLVREAVLHQRGSLQSFSISTHLCSEAFLIPLLSSSTCPSLTSLSILGTIPSSHYPFVSSVASKALQKLGFILAQNTSHLSSFTLSDLRLPDAAIRHLFRCLKQNRHLTFLSLSGCSPELGSNWPIAPILDCLQVNTTLCEFDLTGTSLQNHHAILEKVFRNVELRNVLKIVLRLVRPTTVRPTTVRIFFCGLPYSGKTTLSRSLANWNNNASWLSRATSTSRLKRTRGIEVTVLEKGVGDQHQRILLWDMAGQMEFHSFHDSMFPDLSSRATPSMFLFVWNPFEILDTKGKIKLDPQGQTRRKDVRKFRDEFKYWLRFIASKTLISEIFKPKVLVAITRADLRGFEDIKAWLMTHFTALQEEFQELVQFDEEGFFHLNAKDHVQAGRLGSHLFHCAQAILRQVPDVYQACAEARELLGNMVHDNQIPPLITKDKFHQLCHQELHMDSQEMREAVALSLNDSGDLIYFKSLELVVLDTQWFCHKIMGDLLNDISNKELFDRSRTSDVFFPVSALEALLERIVNSRAALGALIYRRAHKKVAGCDLVKLLVGLRLACQNSSRVFLSISLSGKAKRTLFPSNYLTSDGKSDTYTYLGRRLTCKNFKCTILTPGFFPLLQVTFHNELHDGEVPILVLLEQDVMAFAFGGVKVFIEFCRLEGKDHFIDILVYSSKSLDGTIEWLQENVIQDVENVCAEPRGSQGVELAHAVIQPASIQKFLEARERPAVSLKELQDALKNHVEREGVKLTDDGIKTVMYTWQTDPFPVDSVVDLLGKVETASVVQSYLCGLSDAQREISKLFAEEAETSCQPQSKPQFGMSQSSKEREIIYNTVRESEKNVMSELAKLGHGVEDLRKAVLPKLCELFTFVQEGEAGKLPRSFVVTEDDGIVQRVVSAIVPGLQNLRLKLLCECRSDSCHFVDGKRGLSLATLDDGLLKRGLPYINALLKAAYVAARVGAHIAVGFGNQIPDFTQVLASIIDAPIFDGVAAFPNLTDDWNSSSRVDIKQGQQWLFDVLSNRDCMKGEQIYAVFGLRRVRLPDSKAAWVCDKHYREGTPWPT